jgi:Acyl-coenzyme A synthetases/AMP-(fatty) acid ligases
MLRLQEECSKYDLSSVTSLFTGAAPLGMETAADFLKVYPNVLIRQGYGKMIHPYKRDTKLIFRSRPHGNFHRRLLDPSRRHCARLIWMPSPRI